MRFARLFAAAVLVCLSSAHFLYALDPHKSLTQYIHRIWDQQEGLSQPTVYSILQTHDGFLWLGTQDSLIRFDGLRFREFSDGANPLLHRALVRALLEDRSGNLWAGTIGNGLVRISPQSVATRFNTANGFPGANAFCLDRGDGDDIWACATNSLVHFLNGKFTEVGTQQGLPAATPRATCSSADGTRWVATDNGLFFSSRERFVRFSLPGLSSAEPINALHCQSSGTVWAGTNHGLFEINDHQSRLWNTREGLPDNAVLTLAPGSHQSVWVGTNDGVSRIQDGHLSVYRTRDGLSHSLVLSLFEDREESLWAGTKNGLDQFTDSVVTPYSTQEGLSDDDAGPLAEDRQGRIWVGTLGGGLNVFDGSRFRALTHRNGLLNDNVFSLAVAPDGDLWVGTARGVNRVHNDAVAASYTRSNGLSGAEVRSLVFSADGTLWAGTDRGLDRWTGNGFAPSGLLSNRPSSGVVSLFAGQQVTLFISTAGPALHVYRDGKLQTESPDGNRPADSMFLDRGHHEAWLGTLGMGLLRWKSGVFTHIRVKDGLYDNRIYAILGDDDHNLWLASSKGIFRVSHAELDAVADGRAPFVNSIPFTTGQLRFECQSGVQPAAIRTRDGRLWFSTTGGLVAVDPKHLTLPHAKPPDTSVQAVLVNGRPVHRASWCNGLSLSPAERNVEILYTGLSFLAPQNILFRYRLDGFDRSWTDAGTRREVFFTNLPPGKFTLRLQARNADGPWGGEAAVLRFSVAPRLYQRIWFFPVLALLLAFVGVCIYRLRIRRLRRSFELVISERGRIARELHDTLLQGLSGVTMQLQALWTKLPASREKQWLSDIIKDASRASTEARQSLWGLRSRNSNALSFHEKLANTVRDALFGSNLALELDLEPVALERLPEIEFQLLRIAGEVSSNAAAHSRATHFRVSLHKEKQTLRLRFVDDGVGFESSAPQPFGHYGLVGMRERALEIGAHLGIESSPGLGTVVTIAVSFPRREKMIPVQGRPNESETEPATASKEIISGS